MEFMKKQFDHGKEYHFDKGVVGLSFGVHSHVDCVPMATVWKKYIYGQTIADLTFRTKKSPTKLKTF